MRWDTICNDVRGTTTGLTIVGGSNEPVFIDGWKVTIFHPSFSALQLLQLFL